MFFISAVRGYYVYRDVWEPSIREKLIARQEFDNPINKFAVQVLKSSYTAGHLPREFSRIAWYFLTHGGNITVEVAEEWRFHAS